MACTWVRIGWQPAPLPNPKYSVVHTAYLDCIRSTRHRLNPSLPPHLPSRPSPVFLTPLQTSRPVRQAGRPLGRPSSICRFSLFFPPPPSSHPKSLPVRGPLLADLPPSLLPPSPLLPPSLLSYHPRQATILSANINKTPSNPPRPQLPIVILDSIVSFSLRAQLTAHSQPSLT